MLTWPLPLFALVSCMDTAECERVAHQQLGWLRSELGWGSRIQTKREVHAREMGGIWRYGV